MFAYTYSPTVPSSIRWLSFVVSLSAVKPTFPGEFGSEGGRWEAAVAFREEMTALWQARGN